MFTNRAAPGCELAFVVIQILPMFRRHMFRLYHRIAKYRSVPCMHSNSGAAVENLNRVFGQAQVYLFANQIKGDGVFVHAIRNQVIRPNCQIRRPDRWLICGSRKRLHKLLLFGQIGASAASFALFKRAVIQFFQLFSHRFLRFAYGEETSVSQRRQDPGGRKLHRSFCQGLVLRVLHSGWDNRSIVMLSQFLVTPVENCFIPGIFRNTGLQIIRDQQPGHTAEVAVGMGMTKKPVFQLHVVTGLGIGIAAAR